MSYNRRQFLKTGTALASGLALSAHAAQAFAAKKPFKEFGLQLYSLRDDMPKDPKGILKQVANFGYKQIESYEGAQGMFWGMPHKDFKSYLDDLGMKIVSSHCNINTDFEKKAAQAGEIGMKYLISPYIGKQKTGDDYKKFADQFNACGEICKKNGLRFAYHNHGYTFEDPIEKEYPQDILMKNTDAALVDYQMDIYWVVTPGADPIAWLQKYPNRWRLCHVKDRLKVVKPEEHDASTILGTGSIDYHKILPVAAELGMQYYIVEQERYDNSTPLDCAKADAEYMKNFK